MMGIDYNGVGMEDLRMKRDHFLLMAAALFAILLTAWLPARADPGNSTPPDQVAPIVFPNGETAWVSGLRIVVARHLTGSFCYAPPKSGDAAPSPIPASAFSKNACIQQVKADAVCCVTCGSVTICGGAVTMSCGSCESGKGELVH